VNEVERMAEHEHGGLAEHASSSYAPEVVKADVLFNVVGHEHILHFVKEQNSGGHLHRIVVDFCVVATP
jgi:hypothetical protein